MAGAKTVNLIASRIGLEFKPKKAPPELQRAALFGHSTYGVRLRCGARSKREAVFHSSNFSGWRA